MPVNKDELFVEVDEIKKMMDLLSDLFLIRTAFIYAIDEEQYTEEIACNNGNYQDFCKIVQIELKHKCIACDREKFKLSIRKKVPLLYQCYNGLHEMFLPISIENIIVGYLHFGQVRGVQDFKTISEEFSLGKHSKIAELEDIYNSMNIIEEEKLVLIAELFQRFADVILRDKLIELKRSNPEYYLKKYVEDNLDNLIDIRSAAKFIGRSPSYVTHKFKENYGKNFHEYLIELRIEHSKKLLAKYSISETSKMSGFNNRYHFSKVFKKLEGITPHEYQLTFTKTEL